MKIIIEERPDTDVIERKEKEHYSKLENLEFMECDTCRAKPGSPTLCTGCYYNRLVISKLRKIAKI